MHSENKSPKMKAVTILCSLLAVAFAAPQQVEGPHPAYYKDIEIPPTADNRIVNGLTASRYQFPYQVSLEWGWLGTPSHICGGSIITTRTVVTAAHCIQTYGTHQVVAGILNREESTTDRQERSVSGIISHPGYPGGSVVAPNDIALLIVSSAFTYTSAVSPVTLPSSGASFSGSAVVSGWGRTSSANSVLPTTLQFVTKTLITESECASALISILGSSSPLDSTMVCTSGAQSTSVCSGDSGGPLVQNGVLVGVVSWGISPCGFPNAPSVYTRTASFTNWISSNAV